MLDAVIQPNFMRYPIEQFHNLQGAVITQADGDMGDGLQRTAMYYVGLFLLGLMRPDSFERAAQILQTPSNALVPIRDPVRWTDPHDVSRDQEDPWLIALYFYGKSENLKYLIRRRWRRLGLYANGDVSGPAQIANDIRLLQLRPLKPFLSILDFAYVAGATQDCLWGRLVRGRDGSWLDVDNAMTRLMFTERVWPTWASRFAIWIYNRFFPETPAGIGVLSALRWKHRSAAGANPALAELWSEVWAQTVPTSDRSFH